MVEGARTRGDQERGRRYVYLRVFLFSSFFFFFAFLFSRIFSFPFCDFLSFLSPLSTFFSVTRRCDCAGKVFFSDNFSLFPLHAEEVRGRPFRRVCDVILREGFGPHGIEDRNEDEDVEEGEDETINLLEAVTDLVLDRDDMPVDMPVHQPPRFPLPNEAMHGPISIRGSQTRFDLDWEYVPGEALVPLQNAVNELREFDEAGRHFPVTLDGVPVPPPRHRRDTNEITVFNAEAAPECLARPRRVGRVLRVRF